MTKPKKYKIISIILLAVLIIEFLPNPAEAWTIYTDLNGNQHNLERKLDSQIPTPGDLYLRSSEGFFDRKEGSGSYIAERALVPPAESSPLQSAVFAEKIFSGKVNNSGLKIGKIDAGYLRDQDKYTNKVINYFEPQDPGLQNLGFFNLGNFIELNESGVKVQLERAQGGVKYALIPSYRGELFGLAMQKKTAIKRLGSWPYEEKIPYWTNGLYKFASVKIKQSDIDNWANNNSRIISPLTANGQTKVLMIDERVRQTRSCDIIGRCDNWTYTDGYALAADGRLGEKHTGKNNPTWQFTIENVVNIAARIILVYILTKITLGIYNYFSGGAALTGTAGGTAGGTAATAEGSTYLYSIEMNGKVFEIFNINGVITSVESTSLLPAGSLIPTAPFIPSPQDISPWINLFPAFMPLPEHHFGSKIIPVAFAQTNTVHEIELSTDDANNVLNQIGSQFLAPVVTDATPFGTVESLGSEWGWSKRKFFDTITPWCGDGIINQTTEQCEPPNTATCDSNCKIITGVPDVIGEAGATTNTVRLNATLNGNPWSGSLNISTEEPYVAGCYEKGKLVGATSQKACSYSLDYSVPQVFSDLPLGVYKITGVSGGPAGASLTTSLPYSQTLNSGGNIGFTLNFKSSPAGVPAPASVSTSCGSLTFPSAFWHEIYTVHSNGQCLGERKEDTRWDFDVDWGNGTIDFGKSDDVELNMGRTGNLDSRVYKFILGSDDGSRLYVDNELCVDNWGDHGYQEKDCSKVLFAGNHTFRINYYENGGGARISFKTESVALPAPQVNLSVSPTVVERDDNFVVSWNIGNKAQSNPSSCSASGSWSGSKSVNGGSETIPTSGRRGDYNFNLSCSGSGGANSASVSARVLEYPKCSFSASKSEIQFAPDYSMLSWSCKYATSCSINQGVGNVSNTSGSKKVSPANNAAGNYTLSCNGADGSRNFSTSVKVLRPEGVKYQEF